MKKSLTIEELKQRIGKPVFVTGLIYGNKEWRVLKNIGFGGANTIDFTDSSSITEEFQDRFRFFDEEVAFQELKEILDAEEKAKKKTGYERVKSGQNYWDTRVVKYLDDDNFCNSLYLVGDYVNDEILAKNIERAEKLKYQLRRYAALNGGIPSQEDWKDYYYDKYYIYYDYDDNKIDVCDVSIYRDFGQIYFKSKEACEKAIEIFEKELIWYFTEFQEMLY